MLFIKIGSFPSLYDFIREGLVDMGQLGGFSQKEIGSTINKQIVIDFGLTLIPYEN